MYSAPIKELNFALHAVLDAGSLNKTGRYAEYAEDVGIAVLEEAGKFASEVLDPLNASGDRTGAKHSPQNVTMPQGYRDAYAQFVAAGWPQLGVETEIGGQGMPQVISSAVEEIWFGANMGFMLCPMLANGAIEALRIAGSDALKARFLPELVSGETTGTMNLTEPSAGSDLAAIRTRAVESGDHYRIHGQKIFITYGDHDLTGNIIHLVLARIDGAPAGVKGISLFVVPKKLKQPDGTLITNDLRCVSIEHKLGIHASPTCVMSFGDKEGAVGYLVGEAHHGLEYMFIMMNKARLAVGIQGIGITERAFQQASAWARTRMQGKPIGQKSDKALTIIHHPDVKRMLLTMKSGVQAMRLLGLYAALQLDKAHSLAEVQAAKIALSRAELLIPIVKGWCTEWANELISTGVQIHGGMGYIEETGIAQTLRDARIAAIYEGTTGIQANDLLGRKLGRDHGATMLRLIEEVQQDLHRCRDQGADIEATQHALRLLHEVTEFMLIQLTNAPAQAYAVSVPYLMLCGFTLGGWLTTRASCIAAQQLAGGGDDRDFLQGKIQSGRFYIDHILPTAHALAAVVRNGGDSVVDAEVELI
ncbi:MAG: acyl-CoA dehydrogenase [Steroidobacter sp.]